jgi:uncharacterized protein YndB with AHSA1/START domain
MQAFIISHLPAKEVEEIKEGMVDFFGNTAGVVARTTKERSLMSDEVKVEVNVRDRVLKPVSEVFSAIVDPAKMSGYFISRASGPMERGATIEWVFDDVGAKLSVDVKEIDENRRIVFDWAASGVKARVTIRLESRGNDATLVTINEAGWPMDSVGVKRALGQTAGWTDFLCCMKASLQHGINLRLGRSKEDHEVESA